MDAKELKPGHCHKCGLALTENPHPEAGKPDHVLNVGCPKECIPCLTLSRHSWYTRAMKAEGELRDLRAALPSDAAQAPLRSAISVIVLSTIVKAARRGSSYVEGYGRAHQFLSDAGMLIDNDAAPVAPAAPMVASWSWLRGVVEGIPVRSEPVCGQPVAYVQLSAVLNWIDYGEYQAAAASVAPAAAAPSLFPSLAEFDPEHPLLAKAALPDERTTFLQWVNERPYTPSQMSVEWMWDAWTARATALQAPAPWVTNAARDVLAERARQVTGEGWTPTHDDQYGDHEMSCAAGCYAMHTLAYPAGDPPPAWPWAADWWKPTTHRRNLIKAAALILAEIERIDRAASANESADAQDNAQ